MKKFEKWAKIFILSALFAAAIILFMLFKNCLLYTSPSPRD